MKNSSLREHLAHRAQNMIKLYFSKPDFSALQSHGVPPKHFQSPIFFSLKFFNGERADTQSRAAARHFPIRLDLLPQVRVIIIFIFF